MAGGSQAPFLYNAWFRTGHSIGSLLFLLAFYRDILLDGHALSLTWKRVFRWPDNKFLIVAVVGALDYACFAWSVKFIDVTVAAILYETYPVVIILALGWLFKEEGRYQKITFTMFFLILLSLAGFVFAIASQTGEFTGSILNWNSAIGVVLVVAAAIGSGICAFGLRWGSDLSEDLSALRKADSVDANTKSLDLGCAVIALSVASLASVATSALAGLAIGESIAVSASGVALVGGMFAAVGAIALRKANLVTDNLGVNAMAYFIPILSLLWLFWVGDAEVARFDYIAIGTTAIITANLLISFEAEIRWGFKALILGLGAFGAFVYLRDGLFDFLGVEKWNWSAAGYFESITLSATVFTLLLAFRVTRLVSRTSEEDNRTFIIYRNLDLLARRGVIDGEVCRHILEIDRSGDLSLMREAYVMARKCISDVVPTALNEADSQLLGQAESNLDALIRSKQVDIHLGEMFALITFGAVTIGLALLSRPPQVEGWTRLLADVFAMVVTGVVVFMMVHIQDLQRERDQPKLELPESAEPGTGYWHYLASFPDTARRSFDQWLSIVVGVAIVPTYSGLLCYRWLG